MNDQNTIPCSHLLVDDSRYDATLVRYALAGTGLDAGLVILGDGESALDFLFGERGAQNRAHLRVVFLDLKLPRMGGAEILARIRSAPETRGVPVVILTSSDESGDRARCYALGANSYLVKPTTFEAYADLVRGALGYWVLNNVTPWTLGEHGPTPDRGSAAHDWSVQPG